MLAQPCLGTGPELTGPRPVPVSSKAWQAQIGHASRHRKDTLYQRARENIPQVRGTAPVEEVTIVDKRASACPDVAQRGTCICKGSIQGSPSSGTSSYSYRTTKQNSPGSGVHVSVSEEPDRMTSHTQVRHDELPTRKRLCTMPGGGGGKQCPFA